MHIAFDGTTPARSHRRRLPRAPAAGDGDVVQQRRATVIPNQPVETTEPLPEHVGRHISGSRLPRFVWMQLQAPRRSTLRADVVHFTNGMMPAAASAVVTIHDMSLSIRPSFHPTRQVLLNRPLCRSARRAWPSSRCLKQPNDTSSTDAHRRQPCPCRS